MDPLILDFFDKVTKPDKEIHRYYLKKLSSLHKNNSWEKWLEELFLLDDEVSLTNTILKIFDTLTSIKENKDTFDENLPRTDFKELLKKLFYDDTYSKLFVKTTINYYLYRFYVFTTRELGKKIANKAIIEYKEKIYSKISHPVHVYFYTLDKSDMILKERNPFGLIADQYKYESSKFMMEILTDALTVITDSDINKLNGYFTICNENPLSHLVKHNLFKWTDYFLRIKKGMTLIDNYDLIMKTKTKTDNIISPDMFIYQHLLLLKMNATNRKIMRMVISDLGLKEIIFSIILYSFIRLWNNTREIAMNISGRILN